MYVGVDNSMLNESGRSPLCRVTLFAPFWLDNRTGMDLLFQDHKSAPPNPLFLGANSPFDYAEVEAPGMPKLPFLTEIAVMPYQMHHHAT